MRTLVRSAFVAVIAAAMLLLSMTGPAEAQNGYAPLPPLQGPGDISNTTGILTGEPGSALTDNAAAFQIPVIAAPAGSGTGGGGDLAFTGADSNVLAAGGMTLLLVGGAAVVASRKRS